MKTIDDLKEILLIKGIDNFCDSIEYLKKAGYSETDSFFLSLEFFPPEIENILGIILFQNVFSSNTNFGYIIFFKNDDILLDKYLKYSVDNNKDILINDIKNYKTIILSSTSFMSFFGENYQVKINISSNYAYQRVLFPESFNEEWLVAQGTPPQNIMHHQVIAYQDTRPEDLPF